ADWTRAMAHTSFFFVSSRRRHTRCYRDWSSDVCSSDLVVRDSAVRNVGEPPQPRFYRPFAREYDGGITAVLLETGTDPAAMVPRSEERRVGKEGRWLWAPGCARQSDCTRWCYTGAVESL